MNISSALSFIPSGLMAFIVIFMIASGVVVYVMRIKGDVLAEMSHGKTLFKLEAKERRNSTKVHLSQKSAKNPDKKNDGA